QTLGRLPLLERQDVSLALIGPKGASQFKRLVASVKRCPDTEREFFGNPPILTTGASHRFGTRFSVLRVLPGSELVQIVAKWTVGAEGLLVEKTHGATV